MYRITITAAQPTAKEQIELSCSIEESDDGTTWTALAGAPTTLLLPLSAVRDALRSNPLDADKRAALLELIRTETRALSILAGAVAVEAIEDLLPAGWPVTVAL